MRTVLLSTLLLSLTLAACPARNDLAGISDSTFVDVMARLHRIETDERLSREERDSLRRRTLQEEDLTPEALEEAARVVARDPQRALETWTAIEQKAADPAMAPETPVRRARPVPEPPQQAPAITETPGAMP